MSNSETTPLLDNGGKPSVQENIEHVKVATDIRCVHFVFIPILMLLFLSVGNSFYLIQQWIQHSVKIDLHVSDDVSSTSGCSATNHSSPAYIAYQKVEQKTARWGLYNSLVSFIPAFFGSAIISNYSDSFGRKFAFIVGASSNFLKNISYLMCMYYSLDLKWIVLTTGIDAMSGGAYTIIAASSTYAADITPAGRSRTFGITLVDGLLLVCITLSGLFSGFIIQYQSFVILALINTSVCFLCWIVIFLAFPETYDERLRSNVSSISGNIKRMFDIYTSKAFKQKRVAYILLLVSFFFEEIVISQRSATEILYQLGQPFCWPAGKIGIFTAARHATQSIAGVAFIAPLQRCFSNITIAIGSAVFNCGSYVLEALARTDFSLYLVPVLATLSFLTVPVLKSMMSTLTPVHKQGSLFASIAAVQTVAGIAASTLTTQIYAATVSIFNGFVFMVLAGICAIVIILLLIFAKTQEIESVRKPIEKTINTNSNNGDEVGTSPC